MASCFRKFRYRVGDYSPTIVKYISILNFLLAVAGIVVFLWFGTVRMTIDGRDVTNGSNANVARTLIFTFSVLFINLVAQLMTGVHAVIKENGFEMLIFGLLSAVNNTMLALFWAYTSIPQIEGIVAPLGGTTEAINFKIFPPVGWFFFAAFIALGVIEMMLLQPCYDKLCWNTFKKIGSDDYIQKCYRNFEFAKGAWMLLIWYSLVEFTSLFFFENRVGRMIWFGIFAVLHLANLGFGYYSLRNELKKRLQLCISLIPLFIIMMFTIHYMRTNRLLSHYVRGKMNAILALFFTIFYVTTYCLMMFFAGKCINHFGEGIKDILNKEKPKEEEDTDYVVNVTNGTGKKVVLQID